MRRLILSLLFALLPFLGGWPGTTLGGGGTGGGSGSGGGGTFTFIGSASGAVDAAGTTIATTSGTLSVIAGDLIIVAVQWEDNSTAEVVTLDDDGNHNPLAKDSEVHNAGQEINLHLWYAIADTTNGTASFDAVIDASVQYKKMVAFVYRPIGGTPSKDMTGTPGAVDDTNVSNAVTTGSFSTTGAADVVCAFAGFYTGGSWSSMQINGVTADHTQAGSGMAGWCDDSSAPLSGATATAIYDTTRYWAATAIAFEAN